jgi:hypothetical protein
MKRSVVTAFFLCGLAGLAGCPIYDHESDGCFRDSDCAQNYFCDNATGDCRLVTSVGCTKPSDCGMTSTCTPSGQCASGDCSFYDHSCVAGYRCDSSSGVWQCVASDSGSAGEAGASGATAAAAAGQGDQSGGASGAPDMSGGGVSGAQ